MRKDKNSFEPDLNQRPMDFWQCTTTVHRSTNWAIEGVIVVRLQNKEGSSYWLWDNCYLAVTVTLCNWNIEIVRGDVAQMVERSLSMWEVGGSIPPVSKNFSLFFLAKWTSIHAFWPQHHAWSCGVVVITSALHAEGPQFDPGRDQIFSHDLSFCPYGDLSILFRRCWIVNIMNSLIAMLSPHVSP